MADTKISGLTSLAAADVETDADVLAIVDDSATATKKITVDSLRTAMGPKLDTEQATTSGTEKDFTIAAWATAVEVPISGFSTNGTSVPIIQLGDSGGIETSGYSGSVSSQSGSTSNHSSGFQLSNTTTASSVWHGVASLVLLNASTNTWLCKTVMSRSDTGAVHTGSGSKALSGTLTTVRLTTVNGTDAMDAGGVNAISE